MKLFFVYNTMTDDVQFKPLDENDVLQEMQNLGKLDEKIMNKILNTYSNAISSLIKTASVHLENDGDEEDIVLLEQVRRVLGFCPSEELFIRSKDKVWAVRHHIMKQNANYFLEKDYSASIKEDGNQAFIESLIEVVRNTYEDIEEVEREAYWKIAKKILHCVALYKKELIKLKN
jgi:DNA-binding XRE family transcriptional regulator